MTREDLFLAIGEASESRLARSEWTAVSPSLETQMEGQNMKKTISFKRVIRNVLVAALIVSMLAVTAYAVGGFLIFDSPEEMLTAIFGDETGFDHKNVTEIENPWKPDDPIKNPAYDRVSVDETVMEDITPHVAAVGQSISWNGNTLRVDAQIHDSTTGCGVLTYTVSNPDGLPEYYLQPDGELSFVGAELISFGEYGKSYIIQEKTTDTVLTAAYYYRLGTFEEDVFDITFWGLSDNMSEEQFMTELEAEAKRLREEITEEDILEYVKEELGEHYQEAREIYSEEELITMGYDELAYPNVESRYTCQESIVVDCRGLGALDHRTLAGGAVVITPIGIQVDVTDMDFLHSGRPYISSDSIDVLTLHYSDGTDYPIWGADVDNTLFALNTDKEPEGDEVLGVYMFNRIIDVEKVESITINEREFPID